MFFSWIFLISWKNDTNWWCLAATLKDKHSPEAESASFLQYELLWGMKWKPSKNCIRKCAQCCRFNVSATIHSRSISDDRNYGEVDDAKRWISGRYGSLPLYVPQSSLPLFFVDTLLWTPLDFRMDVHFEGFLANAFNFTYISAKLRRRRFQMKHFERTSFEFSER